MCGSLLSLLVDILVAHSPVSLDPAAKTLQPWGRGPCSVQTSSEERLAVVLSLLDVSVGEKFREAADVLSVGSASVSVGSASVSSQNARNSQSKGCSSVGSEDKLMVQQKNSASNPSPKHGEEDDSNSSSHHLYNDLFPTFNFPHDINFPPPSSASSSAPGSMGGCASKPSAPNGPNHDIASPAAENPPPISEPIVADATAEVPISEPTVADATAEAREEVAEEIKEAPLVDLSEPTGEAPAVEADEEQQLHPGIIELKAEKAEEKAEVEKLVAAEEHPLQ